MALIHKSIGAGQNGVSQIPQLNRPDGYVEDMINCIPTLDSGTMKRNPMRKITDDATLSLDENTWVYSYDRGYTSSNQDDRYSIQLNGSTHRVFNLGTGEAYPINYAEPDDADYLTSSIKNNFAAVTLKDTTIITNKTVVPKIYSLTDDPNGATTENRDYVDINFKQFTPTWTGDRSWKVSGEAPYWNAISSKPIGPGRYGWYGYKVGATTTISIKGQNIVHRVPSSTSSYNGISSSTTPEPSTVSFDNWLRGIEEVIRSSLSSYYNIIRVSGNTIRIQATKATINISPLDVVINVTNNTKSVEGVLRASTQSSLVSTDYFDTTTGGGIVVNLSAESQAYKERGYIWFQKSDPINNYVYTCRVTLWNLATLAEEPLTVVNVTASATDGVGGAAELMATALSGLDSKLEASLVSVGSVVELKAVAGYEILDVNMSDTFGNLASHGWAQTIDRLENLPRSFPFQGAIVKITGEDTDDKNDYFVKRVNDVWQEYSDPFSRRTIDQSTMPRQIKDNNDGTFTVSKIDYERMLVGDEVTNSIPSFLSFEGNETPVIKDVFFHKNRLCFMTDRSILFSEAGRYFNFWRTTVTTTLDSDRIDGFVDSQSALRLEYASALDELIVLFSSSDQFLVSSGNILSAKTIKVSRISAYDVNTEVRPIFVNNELYFCSVKGDYTQIMKYRLSELSGRTVVANDITKQIPRYIPSDVNSFSFSAVNGMMFLTCVSDKNNVYIHKETREDNKVLQSAWFKWHFGSDILNSFVFGNDFYMLTKTPTGVINNDDFVIQDNIWVSQGFWHSDNIWVNNEDGLARSSEINKLDIFNSVIDNNIYLDNQVTPYTSTIDIGKITYNRTGGESRGHLQLKTISVDSDYGEFEFNTFDENRGVLRTINSTYTKNRKPMLYGSSKNVKISVVNKALTGIGFKVNDISIEGVWNIRSSRR